MPPKIYTGRSTFLRANPFLTNSVVQAAGRCEIQSSEDIFDANGILLWARHRRVSPRLLARLSDRELAKPIELCVTALDPVSMLSMTLSLDTLCERSPDFALLLEPHRDALLALLQQQRFDPQALLLLSVLRFGGQDRLTHALAVAAVAVVAGHWLRLPEAQLGTLLCAGLLHDVGKLYLPDAAPGARDGHAQLRHVKLGALCVAELTQCGAAVAELVAQSHERLNGQGFPLGLCGSALGRPSQALSFAEAVADHLCQTGMGAQRVAVHCRVAPGEFAPELVNGTMALAGRPAIGPSCQVPQREPAQVGRALRHLHAELSRVVVLLSMTFGESEAVQEAAENWLVRVAPLMQALRYAGVEDALAQGRDILPATPQEHAELAALLDEVADRAEDLQAEATFRCSLWAELAGSRLVRETIRLLQSATHPGPPVH